MRYFRMLALARAPDEQGSSYPRHREVYEKLAEVFSVDINYLRTENEEFMEDVGQQYGRRGQMQAKEILEQSRGLFAGGTLSPEDEIAFIQEIQQLYLDFKKRAREKYTPNAGKGIPEGTKGSRW